MCLSTRVGLQESSHLDPTNPYSAAKAGAEMLCKAYLTSYKMPIVITRGNNVYGPHQFPEKMIPKFTILASRGEQLPLHGDGSAIRSYLFVEDVAEAFDCVLHKGQVGEVYNIGTERERTVAQVAADIAKHFNLPTAKIVNVKDRAFNDRSVGTGMDVGMRFADVQRLVLCMVWALAGARLGARDGTGARWFRCVSAAYVAACVCLQLLIACSVLHDALDASASALFTRRPLFASLGTRIQALLHRQRQAGHSGLGGAHLLGGWPEEDH